MASQDEEVLSSEDFFATANRHIRDAEKLAKVGGSPESIYGFSGLAVECALKAVIMRRQGMNRWPDRDSKPELYIHDLKRLLKYSGLKPEIQAEIDKGTDLAAAWLTVKDWDIEKRYTGKGMPKKTATEILRCANHRDYGLVPWLSKKLMMP